MKKIIFALLVFGFFQTCAVAYAVEDKADQESPEEIAADAKRDAAEDAADAKRDAAEANVEETNPVLPTGATPGAVWDSLGFDPVERGNLINMLRIDQGVVVGHLANWEITPYVGAESFKDSKDFVWDNRLEVEAGGKLVRNYTNGSIDFALAYGAEHRGDGINPSTTLYSPMLYAEGYFDYNSFNRADTPGDVWFQAGNLTPYERGNVIALAKLEQGLNFANRGNVIFAIEGWGEGGFDTHGNPWNNRLEIGAGVRASTNSSHGSLQLTAGVACFNGGYVVGNPNGVTGCGPAINLELWDGWTKLGRSQ